MNFMFTHDQMILQERVRDFFKRELLPFVKEDEREKRFRPELVKKMGQDGYFSCPLPKEEGGNDWGFVGLAIIAMELGKICSSYRPIMTFQGSGLPLGVIKYGSEAQKRDIVPSWVKGDSLGFVAITEPDAGSDVANIKSTAVDCGDYFELTGYKKWVTFAQNGEWGMVFAYTNKAAGYRGMTCFLVNLKTDENIEIVEINDKIGLKSMPTGSLIFNKTRIPKDRVVGELDQGFRMCMWVLNNGRFSTAAGAVGIIEACLEVVKEHVKKRQQFGRRISSFQMIQSKIAKMEVLYETSKLLTFKSAWLKDAGLPNQKLVAMAKYYASEAAVSVANDSITLLGGDGYLGSCPLERYLLDAKSLQIVEGTTNIMKSMIANIALNETPDRI